MESGDVAKTLEKFDARVNRGKAPKYHKEIEKRQGTGRGSVSNSMKK